MNNIFYFHIGCTYSKEEILKGIEADGFNLIIIDDIGLKSNELTSTYRCVYGMTYDHIISAIDEEIRGNNASLENCHFFTLAEGSIDLLNSILKTFKKEPISKCNESLRNKYWVRTILKSAKFENLEYLHLARNTTEIPAPEENQFPLIVKPVSSMESRNVFKVNNQDELRKACLEIFTKNKTFVTVDHGEIIVENIYGQEAHALIESVRRGEKISLEVLVRNSNVEFFTVISKHDYDNEFFYERADILNAHYFDEHEQNFVKLYLNNLIYNLGVVTSILHVEAFYDRRSKSLNLIEVNFRMGGGSIHKLIRNTFNINIVAEYLKRLSITYHSNVFNAINCLPHHKVWVAFDFLEANEGILKIRNTEALGGEIEWCFEDGQNISKFSTAKFYKIGTLIFTSDVRNLANDFEHLTNLSDNYYQILRRDNIQSTIHNKCVNSERRLLKVLRMSLLIIYVLVCTFGASYLYTSFVSQVRQIANSMSSTLAYHLANGEVYYVASIIHNFKSGRLFSQMAVTDSLGRVIYSTSEKRKFVELYQDNLDEKKYSEVLPIMVDGISIGKLYYNINFPTAAGETALILLLLSGILVGVYVFVARRLFSRLSISAKSETEKLFKIIDNIKNDLEALDDKNFSITFDKYNQIFSEGKDAWHLIDFVKPSVRRLIDLLRDLRERMAEKNRLAYLLDESTKHIVSIATQAEASRIAKQVSHDIRSPLSALNVVLSQIHQIPEDHRVIMRNAVNRINDIANQLLEKSKRCQNHTKTSVTTIPNESTEWMPRIERHLMSSLIESIVAEKQIMYHPFDGVGIESDLNGSYALFAEVDAIELKRALSNLINNSVEAFNNKQGVVTVALRGYDNFLTIVVQDNGCGIPDAILNKLGESGVSHGKNGIHSGSGLGVQHAMRTIASFGGEFRVDSRVNVGTTITITLPKVDAPDWFVDKLVIPSEAKIVSVDDDPSIHNIWRQRFGLDKNCQNYFRHSCYVSSEDLVDDITIATPGDEFADLFLVDYELNNSSQNGLDLIESLGIASKSILVTSLYDDDTIRFRCKCLGVKILPKTMAGFVPIDFN